VTESLLPFYFLLLELFMIDLLGIFILMLLICVVSGWIFAKLFDVLWNDSLGTLQFAILTIFIIISVFVFAASLIGTVVAFFSLLGAIF
jgi:hypothetical protein